eukprot:CAMPEP_0116149326 /NCGR_PEP_ID=MMETSP0329-20121206/18873_1 /TAXON_ID=697910 /ORGANISM="Pseudo-nitzschia arenysensis, Strain B593" /LENGTH=173 /DNA_ID=CAMNT_0003645603 /DNA_START=82 /DNA_END=603 /DNA_ORIENTATION=-
MKLSIIATTLAATALSNCSAFTTTSASRPSVALKAANGESESVGLSRRAAAAAMLTGIVAASPMVAQAASDTSLDFSLPSYDTKMSGFGDGKEAYVKKGDIASDGILSDKLMTDPGADEKEKQRASMQKAEEARKEALAKKKAEQKERDEEAKRRAIEKKKRDKERLANIWNS